MVDLDSKDREAVYGPCGAFGVDGGVRKRCHPRISVAEPCVYGFHHVCTVLVGGVNASFEYHCIFRLYLRIADEVFHVPLGHINPVFPIEDLFYGVFGIWMRARSVDVVGDVIVFCGAVKYHVAILCETHWRQLFAFILYMSGHSGRPCIRKGI